MSWTPIWLTCLATTFMLGSHRPTQVLWSPDGRWLAYSLETRPSDQALGPGWLFDGIPTADMRGAGATEGRGGSVHRLWATRVDSGESVLLEESQGALTAPGWHPDGTALAFGRLVTEGPGRSRFEIVVQDAPDRRRVLRSRPVAGAPDVDMAGLAVAWSPDGRMLVVPEVQPRGLAVLRADTGRLLHKIDGASCPAWSPDGGRLAFHDAGGSEGLYCLDATFGPPRLLTPLSGARQAPIWSRDGQSVLVVSRKARRGGADLSSDQADLLRVHVENGRVEKVKTLTVDPIARDKDFRGASFSLDREGEELFYSVTIRDQPASITWFRVRDNATFKLFSPLDITVPIGALAVSPADRRLALRVDSPDGLTLPALCELESERFAPLVPDDSARMEWVATIAAAARSIILASLPGAIEAGLPSERPTLLPSPGEINPQEETMIRLRRLARIGRPLCDRAADAPAADAEVLARLDEARLFFDYLRQEYPAALAALDVVERRTTRPDRRLRLLGLRAQIHMGLGDLDRARDAIGYLRSARPGPSRRIEMTPAGPSVTTDPSADDRWPDLLSTRLDALEAGPGPEISGIDPRDPTNFDAPQPGLGLDRIEAPVRALPPAIQGGMIRVLPGGGVIAPGGRPFELPPIPGGQPPPRGPAGRRP